MLSIFDQAGLCLGSGSACSSGSLLPSKIMKFLGHSDLSKHALRLSFHPHIDSLGVDEILSVVQKIGH
jgi:cysteine desulfurase